MMPTMLKAGCVPAVIYFLNHRDTHHPIDYVMLAPYSDYPTPEGYSREFADTLAAVDRLQSRLQRQEYDERRGILDRDDALLAGPRQKVRDDLYARMTSSESTDYEKEFIRLYLQLRDDKRAKYRQRFLEYQAFIRAQEMDLHGRHADEERWDGTADMK